MTSILAAIKQERKLTFNHWRYRLLHWTFGLQPKKPSESKLPHYFYTHYCPLFHLTNLLAIISPIVLAVKLTAAGALFVAHCLDTIFTGVGVVVKRLKIERAKVANEKEPEPWKPTKEYETQLVFDNLKASGYFMNHDFETFWACEHSNFEVLKKEEVEQKFNAFKEKILQWRVEREAREAARRERMAFWVNFSQVFFKGLVNVFYVALTCFVAWVLYKGIPVYIWCAKTAVWLSWMFVANIVPITTWLSCGFAFFGAVYILTCAILRSKWAKVAAKKTVQTSKDVLTAHVPMPKKFLPTCVSTAFSKYVVGSVEGAKDFVHMFYENNCPPITILSGEDAEVEAALAE